MENFNEQKLRMLEDIGKLTKLIKDDIDWFIASFQEKDPKRRVLARFMSDKKQVETTKFAKELYEQYK
jgi:hypothetical protein